MITKRWTWTLVVASALFLAVGAASCGGDDDGGGGGDDKIKVGLVTDTGGVDDRGFNQFSIAGLDKAESELDIEKRVYVSNSADDYEPNLQAAVDDGNDFVVAVGFLLAPIDDQGGDGEPGRVVRGRRPFLRQAGRRGMCGVEDVCGRQRSRHAVPVRGGGYLAGIVAALTTKTQHRVHGRRHQDPAGRQLDRGLPGRRQGHEAGRQDPERVLERLQRRGEVQGDRARPDLTGLRRRVPGRGRLRPRGTRRGLREERDRDRRRRRPVGAGRLRAHERAQAARPSRCSESSTTFVKGDFKGGDNQFFGVQDLPDAKLLAPFTPAASQEIQDAVAKAEASLKDGSIDPPATLK